MAEALRIKGEVLLAGKGDAIAAAEHFRRSMALAHRQGGLSWELRAAMSFARSWRDRGEIGAARDLLTSVYGRFTEGYGTADLLSARTLLEQFEAQSSDSG